MEIEFFMCEDLIDLKHKIMNWFKIFGGSYRLVNASTQWVDSKNCYIATVIYEKCY